MAAKPLKVLLILLLLSAALLPRLSLLSRDLPYYSIDENDVVEPALACVSGDWSPRRYDYGPLASYLLALVFLAWRSAASLLYGWSREEFFYRAFFQPETAYVLARGFHAALVLITAFVARAVAARHFHPRAGAVALVLGLAPLLDLTTEASFTFRIDTLQGLLALLCLWALMGVGDGRVSARDGALAGLALGFSLATKPFTGLLLLPAVAAAFALPPDLAGRGREVLRALRGMPANRVLWLTFASAAVGHFLANPFALLGLKGFFGQLHETLTAHSGSTWQRSGYDFRWTLGTWGFPFAVAFFASLAAVLPWRRRATAILGIYCATFLAAFLPFSVRPYWYNSILPSALPLVALLIVKASAWPRAARFVSPGKAAVLLTALTVVVPWYGMVREAWDARHPAPSLERRSDYAAQLWIEGSIPTGSRMLAVGWYAINLPRLAASTPEGEARWSEHFMYGRGDNRNFVRAFAESYARRARSGRPVYEIINIRRNYEPFPSDPGFGSLIENLDLVAKKDGCVYIITASSRGFSGAWEGRPGVSLMKAFNRASGHIGDEVKVFRVG